MQVINSRKILTSITRYENHAHKDVFEIVYQLNGSYTMTAGGKSYEINAGDVIILPPNVPHSGEGGGEPYKDMYVQARGLDFDEVAVVRDADGAILSLMEMIHRVTTEKGDNYHAIADSLLEVIVAYVGRYLKRKSKYDFVSEFKNLMYQNISNSEFDLAAEIKKSGYTQDHFRRCFKQDTGTTPLDYLTTLRITQAKKLLRAMPPQSVESIAAGCGFKDEFYFSRTFKKRVGISPLAYRKG